MDEERWLPVVGFEGAYSVSDFGRVRSEERRVLRSDGKTQLVKRKILSPATKRTGHKTVQLYRAGERTNRHHVHRLVLLSFVGAPPTVKHEGAHNDGDATNNRLENLRWATRSNNLGDKVLHGTHNRGERHPLCTISAEVVRAVRAESCPRKETAERFGLTFQTVWAIQKRKTRIYD